ncbi:MAG: right-handed parallel beta-helix repeat-containing protein [Caulobacter sp.]|nr:right-handed parallel beta-helix repeat-containing protein [Caulobacter sp.]
MKTLTRFLPVAAAALGVALTLQAAPAQAFPDNAAKVDQQIRPNFGGLITPPLKPRYRPDRWKPGRYRFGRRQPGWNDYYPPNDYYPRDLLVATVDCGDTSQGPTPVSDALRSLADGGILYIRGGVCRETVLVEYPVIIAAEGASVFNSDPNRQQATIAAPDGAPCIRIAEGVKGVELRDLVLTSEKGGRSACVESWSADVALVRTSVQYWGDAAAVFSSGGKLILRESSIDAHTWDAAVTAESTVLDIVRTRITGEETGLDVTPATGESRIEQTGIMARATSGSAGNGILVRGLRSGSGNLGIRNAVVCGWRNGLHLDRGAQVDVSRSRFCRTTVGVVSDGQLRLTESAIGSRDVGVYVAGGNATIQRNRIHDWSRRPVWVEQGATADVESNWVYYGGDCWRERWDRGTYCVRQSSLPQGLRDESSFGGGYREWWESDGYDRGYGRDGAPSALPPPQPPAPTRKGWGRRSGPPAPPSSPPQGGAPGY